MLHDDQLGRLPAALGYRQQRTHPELFHLSFIEDGYLQAMAASELTRLGREVSRRANIARQVAEVSRKIQSAGKRLAFLDGPPGVTSRSAVRHGKTHPVERVLFAGFLALQLVEVIRRIGDRTGQ